MSIYLEVIAGIIIAYLIGSIPTSVWLGRIFHGIDVREHGSGNAGATNTIRVLGLKTGIPVLVIDGFKGWFSIHLAYFIGGNNFENDAFINYQIALGIAAFLGHVFPIFAGFRGGKGIATLTGVLIALFLKPFLVILGLFIIIFILTRYVSLGSILCSIAFPFIVIFIFHITTPSLIVFSIIIAVFVPYTHKSNIKRLLKGEESKLMFKKK
ncbi:MAG: glycerol-3-phosphate 1-O-acyltransferase PlsY [Saprospiraceae bacterium]|nr:glycerol-3-phosphate 1-O-acyltransferase PlsY [Saprospiraceae bacterium]